MTRPARRLFRLIEPIHAVTYFHPLARAAHEERGLRGFWRGYFAMRAAPFGAVGPEPVTAAFFNFHPSVVARALPAVWELATPDEALAARVDGAEAALTDVFGPPTDEVWEAAERLEVTARHLPVDGRVLFAVNHALEPPSSDRPWAALWHATTLLREHRGDGHSAALVAEGLTGVDAHRLRVANDGFPAERVLGARGWSDREVAASERRLLARGWLDEQGTVTDDGRAAHHRIEAATDLAAELPTERLGAGALRRLEKLLAPLVAALEAREVMPYPNEIGVDRPA